MVKKGKNFSRKVTPLFDSMLVQQTKDEGDASKRPSDSPPIPSPPHLSKDQPQIQPDLSPRPSLTTHIPDSIPEGSGRNHKGQPSNDASLSGNEDGLTLQSGRKSVKTFKGEPFVHKDLAFNDLDDFVDVDDILDYMETEDVQNEERNKGTDKGNKSTDKEDGGTDSTKVSTNRQGEGTADQNEGKSVTQTAPTPTPTTPTPTTSTPIVFGDDEIIAQVLIIMSQKKEKLKEKEKGVELRDVEETKRPRPTSPRSILTLRPILKIDLKDKVKKRIEEEDESDTESEGITKTEKKFKQLANDEEVARKARLNADKIYLLKNFKRKRERCKKHSDLKTKSFDEIQVLYEKIKRFDDSFIAIGSAKDEKVIKEMNEQVVDASKKRIKKGDSV
ncbi:hypothetical protein Tco_1498412 [Tanacetum coccineum]